MKFRATAECMPKRSATWFFSWMEGQDIEANTIEEAQAKLDLSCKQAGTDKDEYFDAYGPIAERVTE